MAAFPTEIAVLPFRIGVAPFGTESILSVHRSLPGGWRRIARRDRIVPARKRTAAVSNGEDPDSSRTSQIASTPAQSRC